MTATTATAPRRLLVTLALAFALLVASGSPLHAGGHGGHNSQDGHCISSYNYADPGTGYLFASTSGHETYPDQCAHVEVSIRNFGCGGDRLTEEYGIGYVDTSTVLPSGSWSMPCSAHYGGFWVEAHWLPFNY